MSNIMCIKVLLSWLVNHKTAEDTRTKNKNSIRKQEKEKKFMENTLDYNNR
jgi:hypothetical protein